MSKVDNKSQFDMGMTLKKSHQDQVQALRVVNVDNYVQDWYSRVVPVYNLDGSVTSAKFYQDNTRPSYKVTFISNSSNILIGKHFLINTGGNRKKFYVWFDDSLNSGTDPMIAGRVGIRVEIEDGDSAAIVAFAVASALKLTHEFSATTNGYTPILEISSVEKGYADPMLAGDSGFTISVLTQGYSNLIKELTLTQVPNARYVFNELQNVFELIDTSPVSVTIDNPTFETGPIKGTIDGTDTGTEYIFVNNLKTQILATHDREQEIIYADFGTKDQRIVEINYTSDTFPGVTAKKTIEYTLVGNRYRRDKINWEIL